MLKDYYAKQQMNYTRNLTDMYGLIVVFDPTRATPVFGGRNEGLNLGTCPPTPKAQGTGIMAVTAA